MSGAEEVVMGTGAVESMGFGGRGKQGLVEGVAEEA